MAACALATSLNISAGGESLGTIVNIERAHVSSATAVLAIATNIASCLIKITINPIRLLIFSCTTDTASSAIATACADASTRTAATIATIAAIARP